MSVHISGGKCPGDIRCFFCPVTSRTYLLKSTSLLLCGSGNYLVVVVEM